MIREAMLWAKGPGHRADCVLCAHRCRIQPGKFGVCGVRENRGGGLVTHVYGEVVAANVDPIEKKPFYHFLPGSTSFSIAAPGCNFRCGFCQNWEISQLRVSDGAFPGGRKVEPREIVGLAREAGLRNTFVTNGYMTAEALEEIGPYLDAANVDLKAFRDETYKKVCKARLAPVLETIRLMRSRGVWVEVTTLVVPGLNDGEEELRGIAEFLAGIDRDMPWHLSRFHPDYELLDTLATPVATLKKAGALGREAGLRYVYIGNVPGEGDQTICPGCGRALIRRHGFWVDENRVESAAGAGGTGAEAAGAAGGRCPFCATPIAGVFA